MNENQMVVYVVDDDDAFRHALQLLLSRRDWCVVDFPSAEAFLAGFDPARPSCLVLDVRMPGLDGTELQASLVDRGVELPIIFLTGHGELAMGVQAMRRGAVNFLAKPVDKETLLASVDEALRRDAERRQRAGQRAVLDERMGRLSQREREVLDLVVDGLANKQIAAQLDVTSRTVEFHRSNIMHKLGVDSLAALVRMAVQYRNLPAASG